MAGGWHAEVHESPIAKVLRELGHSVAEFRWHAYFRASARWFRIADALQRRVQNKLLIGPELQRLNSDFIHFVGHHKPDVVFINRGTHIFPETLHRLHATSPGALLAACCNDDPFSPAHPKYMWRHFVAGIPKYDVIFAYRARNLKEFKNAGAKRAELLLPWFVPELHRPVRLDAESETRFACDVTFVGHFEDDTRLQHLKKLVDNGINLRLHGPEWHRVSASYPWMRRLGPIQPVFGEDYVRALCGAKIALCFFSRLNRDTYTRRCFEIPATGTMLLSEYSDDMPSFYEEGSEAEFFRDADELLMKVRQCWGSLWSPEAAIQNRPGRAAWLSPDIPCLGSAHRYYIPCGGSRGRARRISSHCSPLPTSHS